MYSKRVFSKNDLNNNYKDYNTIKTGNEILKSIKIQDNNAILSRFTNYNTWQTLNTSYFKNFNNNNNNLEESYAKNLHESHDSFIDEKRGTSISITSCSLEKNNLYPYGNISTKKKIAPFFHTNIHLCKWHNKNEINPENEIDDIDEIKEIKEINAYLRAKSKGLNETAFYDKNANPNTNQTQNATQSQNTKLKPLFI